MSTDRRDMDRRELLKAAGVMPLVKLFGLDKMYTREEVPEEELDIEYEESSSYGQVKMPRRKRLS